MVRVIVFYGRPAVFLTAEVASFFGRLFRVDLIKPVSNVRTFVRPQNVS